MIENYYPIFGALYLVMIAIFANINRKATHNIPKNQVIIFFVFCVATAVVFYIFAPSLPLLFGLPREMMGGVYMGIWGIVFFAIFECLIQFYRKKMNH